jgi:hypothetical protein
MYTEIAAVTAEIVAAFAADGVAVTFTGNVKVTPEIAAVWYEISNDGYLTYVTPDAADAAGYGETLIGVPEEEMPEAVAYVAYVRAD